MNTFSWKFEGSRLDDEHYTDYEFTNGEPCKLFVLTRVKDNSHWYGSIMTSATPDGEFDQEIPMPREMVDTLFGAVCDIEGLELPNHNAVVQS